MLKRILITTFFGLVFGFVCLALATSNPDSNTQLTTDSKWLIVISRTLLGFTIGISALRIKWYWNGILIGFIVSIPMAVRVSDRPGIMIATLVMGMIYGFLIELIASLFFKSRAVMIPKTV